MRKVIALLVASLALVGMVSAYSSATVVSEANMSVVKSDTATLAVSPGTGLDENSFLTANGELNFDFNKAIAGKGGLQANSSYRWLHAFTVTNNSKDTIGYYVSLDGTNPYITVYSSNPDKQFVYHGSNTFNSNGSWPQLASGQSVNFLVQFDVADDAPVESLPFNLVVHGLNVTNP